MRHVRLLTLLVLGSAAYAQQPFTLQQVLSAPFANQLTAAPAGNLFAWVEDAEGRHNLYVGGPNTTARALTHNTEDDGQDITQLAWSPDGSAIAYSYGAPNGSDGKPANPAHLQRATPVTVIVQPLAADAKAVVIGEGRAPLFTHDGDSLLFVREGQIWIACVQRCGAVGAASHQLVFDRGSASQLTLSPDDNTLAFISRRREVNQPAHSLLALFDLQTKTLSFPAPSTGDDLSPVFAPAFSPEGKQLAWLRAPFTDTPEFAAGRTSPNPWSIQLYDFNTNTTRTVFTPEANKPGSALPHLSNGLPYLLFNADSCILFFSEADGWLHVYKTDPRKPDPPVLLTPGNFEVEDATLNHWNRWLEYAANDQSAGKTGTPSIEDSDRRHTWMIDSIKMHQVPTPSTQGEGIETQPVQAGGAGASMVSSDRFPMHPASWGKSDHDTTTHEYPLRPEAAPKSYPAAALVTPQQVLFDSSDGMHLHGQLFLPKQEADSSALLRNDKEKELGNDKGKEGAEKSKHPALIFVHGGPHRQMLLGYPAMDYYSNAYAMNQYLVSRGFIVLSVNYRCGIGYGLDFRQCEHAGATGGMEYNDVLAAQKYLASRADVDAKRIGIWGGSYGGYLTALALSRNSDLFAAGVDFHGVHDWNLEDNAGDWKRGTFAEQDAIGAKALASSPMADLSKWHSPILLIHGDNDPNVAYAQTPLLAEALRARNASLPAAQQVDVEELVFPDEVHEFLLHKDWLAAYTAAAAFFERVLKP